VAKLLSPCFWQNKNKKLRFAQNKKSKNTFRKASRPPRLVFVAILWQTDYADTPQKRGQNGYHRKTHRLQTHSVLRRTEIYADAQNPK
jgi:hypothetical protein